MPHVTTQRRFFVILRKTKLVYGPYDDAHEAFTKAQEVGGEFVATDVTSSVPVALEAE